MPTCNGPTCEAEVVFVPSAKSGRTMILDAVPRKGVVVEPASWATIATASVVDVYTDHHGTCVDFANGWRPGR